MKNIKSISLKTLLLTATVTSSLVTTSCQTILSNVSSATAEQGATKAKEVNHGPLGLIRTSDIETHGDNAFKGKSDVVIGNFKIGFFEDKDTSKKQGFGRGNNSTGANIKLLGISDSTMQEVTDAAYADFIAKLKGKGYNISSNADFKASDTYKNLTKYKSGHKEDGLAYYAPKSIGEFSYLVGDMQNNFSNSFSNIGAGFKIASIAGYADKSGKPVINVTYNLDFANAMGGGLTSLSAIHVSQGVSVTPGSKVDMIVGAGGAFNPGMGSVTLGQPVSTDKEFGTIKETTSTGSKVGEAALNGVLEVASMVSGSGGSFSSSSRSFEISANDAKFKSAAIEVAKAANDALINKMAQLKQ